MVTKSNRLIALDCKMTFDENALFRHHDVHDMRDENEMDPLELEASRHDLNYVKLEGDIGCMVNGAGLAMATMDIIQHYGGEPANFMDIAGAATKERVACAFKLIFNDPGVKGILVNVFGGMMRCNSIAEGIVGAAREVGPRPAAGGAPRRHQRRAGPQDPAGIRACPSSRRPPCRMRPARS